MTTKPELNTDIDPLPGLAALVLFGVIVVTVLNASFGQAQGFPEGAAITRSIGYSMFGIPAGEDASIVASENFLIAFETIDVVLVAALVGAVMLARREAGGTIITALRSDQDADESEGREVATDGGNTEPGGDR